MEVLAIFGVPTLVFTMWLVFAPWRGYALSVLWGWFIVPLGVPALPLWQAIGVCMIASFLTHQQTECTQKEKAWVSQLTWALIGPAFLLLFGWLTLGIFK